MEYSAVSQPRPVLLRKAGTLSSMDAAQMTLVRPISIIAEPPANSMIFRVIRNGLISSQALPPSLMEFPF
jgi:hypothetical protein